MNPESKGVPNWLRWVLLLPAAMLGGFVVGVVVDFLNSRHAASPNAPIIFISAFLSGLALTFVSLAIAHEVAPSHKRIVVIVLGVVAIIADLHASSRILNADDYRTLCMVGGNLTACFVAWRKFVRKKQATA